MQIRLQYMKDNMKKNVENIRYETIDGKEVPVIELKYMGEKKSGTTFRNNKYTISNTGHKKSVLPSTGYNATSPRWGL